MLAVPLQSVWFLLGGGGAETKMELRNKGQRLKDMT